MNARVTHCLVGITLAVSLGCGPPTEKTGPPEAPDAEPVEQPEPEPEPEPTPPAEETPSDEFCEESSELWDAACAYHGLSGVSLDRYPAVEISDADTRSDLDATTEIEEYEPDRGTDGAIVYRIDAVYDHEIVVDAESAQSLYRGDVWFRLATTPGEVVTLLFGRMRPEMYPNIVIFETGGNTLIPTTLSVLDTDECANEYEDRVDFVATSDTVDVHFVAEYEVEPGDLLAAGAPLTFFAAEGTACR